MNLQECSQITAMFPAILLDAYGVFWNGETKSPYIEASAAMKSFLALGKLVGILSNSSYPSEGEIEKLKDYGLFKGVHFHFFITSEDLPSKLGKPSLEPFSEAIHRFKQFKNISPCDILMIGDTPQIDIRGAKNAGLSSALVTETGYFGEKLKRGNLVLSELDTPDYFIKRLCL